MYGHATSHPLLSVIPNTAHCEPQLMVSKALVSDVAWQMTSFQVILEWFLSRFICENQIASSEAIIISS